MISSSTLNKEKGIVNKIRPRFLHSSIKNVAIDVKFRMRIKGDSNLESYTGSDYITQKIHIHPYVYKIVCPVQDQLCDQCMISHVISA